MAASDFCRRTGLAPKLSSNRRWPRSEPPPLPLKRIQRIISGQKQIKVGKIVVAPKEFASHLHRGHAEDALGNRSVGLLAQQRFDLGALRTLNQLAAWQTDLVGHTLHHGGFAYVESSNPHCLEQRVDQPVLLL